MIGHIGKQNSISRKQKPHKSKSSMNLLQELIQRIDKYLNDYSNDKKRVRWSSVVRKGFTYSSDDYDRTVLSVNPKLRLLPKNVLLNEEMDEIEDSELDNYVPLKRCQSIHVFNVLSDVFEHTHSDIGLEYDCDYDKF